MVLLDKAVEKCCSNQLDALGVQKLLDKTAAAGVSFSLFTTDECSEVKTIVKDRAMKQLANNGVEMVIQNDPFHKIKNSRISRKDKFEDPRIKSQKFSITLQDLKVQGLQQIGIQLKP